VDIEGKGILAAGDFALPTVGGRKQYPCLADSHPECAACRASLLL
jgi:hypothetical protein